MSIDRGMDKEGVVHIYNGILLSHKMEYYSAIKWNTFESVLIRCEELTHWKRL